MNRLVIIGNGFDLAHGLPTSYKDFIDDYWSSIKSSKHNDDFIYFIDTLNIVFEEIKGLNCIAKCLMKFDEKIKFSEAEIYTEYGNNHMTGQYPRRHILNYKNSFFKAINQKNVQNWVDIENEYYRQLKKIINSKCLDVSKSIEYWQNEQKIQVQELNKEFEYVKILLGKYLKDKVKDAYKFNYHSSLKSIYDVLKPISLTSNEHDVLKEFNNSEDVEEIKDHFEKEKKEELVNKLYFLNFNYTPTVKIYSDILNTSERIETKVNYIHGELENVSDNKMNFGFGDEMDEDYKEIENLDDNEYLKNFKSFLYLQNSNYNDLLSYVESEKFQVIILGHSCGLSDRTLLNTIFEHENCRSIKVFYYKNGEYDNYTDMVQNISRHFNDKKIMRSKIVSKPYCKPMPQIQLTKKE
ncbi:AbiH family protein [uncultured Flavobacterium sp.]|uniref:AbiH family protein n=1 Tax=uncultured Flavobacterium sp. TaxID=165435 RepID=UPI0030EEED29